MKGPINILILGKEGVGKTAIVVRFLTRRYLSEYAHAPEMTYERVVAVAEKQVPVKITDCSGKCLDNKGSKDLLSKVDGIVVVYAIDDLHSFDVAEGICDWLRRDRKHASQLPLVLLGNKSDLDHRRRVSGQNTQGDLEWRGECYLATECSASNGCDRIYKSFNMLIQKVIDKREVQGRQQRKLSQAPLGSPKMIRASIKRRFSVFTRDRTSTM